MLCEDPGPHRGLFCVCVCVELLYRRAAPSKERPGKKFTGLSCLLLKEKIFYFCFIWIFLVRGALLGKNGRVLACDEALCGFTGEAVGMLRHIIRSHSDCKIIIIIKKNLLFSFGYRDCRGCR